MPYLFNKTSLVNSCGNKNNLRLWTVYDPILKRIDFVSVLKSECQSFAKQYYYSRGLACEVLRFDLSKLYYD